MVIPVLMRPLGVLANCCDVKPVPSQFTDTSVAFPKIIPSPLVMAPPQAAFNPCGKVIYSPMLSGCIVEGPIATNANGPCGLQTRCSLILTGPINETFCGEAMFRPPAPSRGGVAPSTSVVPVNIQKTPEPPSMQTGPSMVTQGQVPGSTNISIQSNATMAMLVFGAILVGLYFVSR